MDMEGILAITLIFGGGTAVPPLDQSRSAGQSPSVSGRHGPCRCRIPSSWPRWTRLRRDVSRAAGAGGLRRAAPLAESGAAAGGQGRDRSHDAAGQIPLTAGAASVRSQPDLDERWWAAGHRDDRGPRRCWPPRSSSGPSCGRWPAGWKGRAAAIRPSRPRSSSSSTGWARWTACSSGWPSWRSGSTSPSGMLARAPGPAAVAAGTRPDDARSRRRLRYPPGSEMSVGGEPGGHRGGGAAAGRGADPRRAASGR